MLCRANQWTVFNMITASAMKELMWQSKSVIDLQDFYELPYRDWFSQRFFFESLDFYISFRVELFSRIQTLRNFAVLNFRESWSLCVGCSIYLCIIYMCFIIDGNRRIYCNITEIEIDQSIRLSIHAIKKWNCSHFELKLS